MRVRIKIDLIGEDGKLIRVLFDKTSENIFGLIKNWIKSIKVLITKKKGG